jgi:hypothetical protein
MNPAGQTYFDDPERIPDEDKERLARAQEELNAEREQKARELAAAVELLADRVV